MSIRQQRGDPSARPIAGRSNTTTALRPQPPKTWRFDGLIARFAEILLGSLRRFDALFRSEFARCGLIRIRCRCSTKVFMSFIGRGARPQVRTPLLSSMLPWQGQRHAYGFSGGPTQGTTQPRCGHFLYIVNSPSGFGPGRSGPQCRFTAPLSSSSARENEQLHGKLPSRTWLEALVLPIEEDAMTTTASRTTC